MFLFPAHFFLIKFFFISQYEPFCLFIFSFQMFHTHDIWNCMLLHFLTITSQEHTRCTGFIMFYKLSYYYYICLIYISFLPKMGGKFLILSCSGQIRTSYLEIGFFYQKTKLSLDLFYNKIKKLNNLTQNYNFF